MIPIPFTVAAIATSHVLDVIFPSALIDTALPLREKNQAPPPDGEGPAIMEWVINATGEFGTPLRIRYEGDATKTLGVLPMSRIAVVASSGAAI
jgi:hypothetical protein|tara:strand:- start:1489 stop:1770 length:282 start_codon:yes stop_codon:yes gene_type:complete